MSTIWVPTLSQYDGPKYQRLVAALEQAIADNSLAAGVKLPPQRRLADKLGVTVGTVTRAYALAEQRGLVEARVGAGTYVRGHALNFDSSNALSNDPNYAQPSSQDQNQNQKHNLATCQQMHSDQLNVLSDALATLARDPAKLAALLGYRASPLKHQQAVFSRWLKRRGILQQPEQLLFSHGAHQGIFATLNALMKPGDTLLHEQYCYPGIRVAAKQLGLANIGVPMTDEGLDLEALEQLVQRHSPRILYLTPNNQNPTCICYSQPQRQAILELAKRYEFYIIEDDVNYCLPEERLPPLWNLEADSDEHDKRVIYVSSLSKLFAGGLRQGFMLLPPPLMGTISQALHGQCWMVSPLNIEIACQILAKDALSGNRDQQIRRRQAQSIAMGERLGLVQRWRGLNGWLQLPTGVKAHHAVTALAMKGILVRNGDDFECHDNCIRLSIGGVHDDGVFTSVLGEIEATLQHLARSAYSVV
jgi:DNA-binding transcriptional MocR family regulator